MRLNLTLGEIRGCKQLGESAASVHCYDAAPVQARFEYTIADFREYHRHVRRRTLWVLWPLVLAMGFLVGIIFLANASTAPTPSPAGAPVTGGSLLTVFLPLVPWIVIFTAITFSLRFVRRIQGPRAMLARTIALQGEMLADVDAAGVSLQSRLYRAHYHWEAVTRFRETRRLFLLFVGPNSAMVLPKRGFATQEELDAMRAMAQKLAGHPGAGFPVVPPPRAPSPGPG
jgi:hypothetical protein